MNNFKRGKNGLDYFRKDIDEMERLIAQVFMLRRRQCRDLDETIRIRQLAEKAAADTITGKTGGSGKHLPLYNKRKQQWRLCGKQ